MLLTNEFADAMCFYFLCCYALLFSVLLSLYIFCVLLIQLMLFHMLICYNP
jgi:hypothetical protein